MLLAVLHRFLGRQPSIRDADEQEEMPVEITIARIQQGDVKLRIEFITNYQPLIAKMTSRFCRRYIDPTRDDEYSIALMAFDEAINQYSSDAAGSFFGFAETVIRRRLIDHLRRENRHQPHIPYSAFDVEDEENNLINPLEIHQSIERYEREKLRLDRQQEIEEYAAKLAQFGISFRELTKLSPKHRDAREKMIMIGKSIAANEQWMETLMQKKMLPIKELSEHLPVSRKTLERNRKYLIAIALIAGGAYPHLQDYLRLPEDVGREEPL